MQKKSEKIALSRQQIMHLCKGWHLGGSQNETPFKNGEHRRQCWLENRELILSFKDDQRPENKWLSYKGDPAAMRDYEQSTR